MPCALAGWVLPAAGALSSQGGGSVLSHLEEKLLASLVSLAQRGPVSPCWWIIRQGEQEEGRTPPQEFQEKPRGDSDRPTVRGVDSLKTLSDSISIFPPGHPRT